MTSISALIGGATVLCFSFTGFDAYLHLLKKQKMQKKRFQKRFFQQHFLLVSFLS